MAAPENYTMQGAKGMHHFTSDVWAYGFCLYALNNKGIGPWTNLSAMQMQDIEQITSPLGMRPETATIMRRCFVFQRPMPNRDGLLEHRIQSGRISIDEIYERLQNIEDNME